MIAISDTGVVWRLLVVAACLLIMFGALSVWDAWGRRRTLAEEADDLTQAMRELSDALRDALTVPMQRFTAAMGRMEAALKKMNQ